jgi:ribonuclease HII
MQTADFSRETTVREAGLLPIGIDEAGRGPLAGPVVAAAVLFKSGDSKVHEGREREFNLIRDSKKLSEKQRETAFALVQEFFHVGVGIISAETIDRVNILQATFLAMKAALSELERVAGLRGKESSIVLLIDGNQELPNLSLRQVTVVDGDALVKSIAAASIIAKVTRDRLIILTDHEYPAYGFARHKGYGTKEHMEALRKYGPTPIHRKSFRPVQLANPDQVNERFSRDLQPRQGARLAKKRSI